MGLKVRDSIKGNYKTACLVVLLVGLFLIGLNYLLNIFYKTINFNYQIRGIVTIVIIFIVFALLYLGYVNFFLKISRSEKGEVKDFINKPELFLSSFIILITTFLVFIIGSIFFIVPGVILAIMFSQAPYIAIDNPELGGLYALKRSVILMKGRKKEYFRYILYYLKPLLRACIVFILYIASLKITITHIYLVHILNVLLLSISIILLIDFSLIFETAKAVYYNKLIE